MAPVSSFESGEHLVGGDQWFGAVDDTVVGRGDLVLQPALDRRVLGLEGP